MTTINQKQVELIKKEIDEQLRLRCINVETTLVTEEKRGGQSFTLTSTEFNTVPVIHSAIGIQNFGGRIFKDESNPLVIRFYISVNAFYEGNGVELFEVMGLVNTEQPDYVFFESRKTTRSSY